ncbi:DMSO/TMAO reductase YedYZ, molybdopterin-dependent catalytic subunit [Klenkia soli]|uniref:DMSO/TMAO reductase YedYZ, molybdopterin-dependent catalytic subunit n=1 Tax=Klenkia soli TaxID=1052260 RepID=A0A1H0UR19_9ACTN|nr:molybdopterin-dependent oxidoreductase [Klenkia soli]SDP68565.1 DMSO/TMAO reductase YedYZ, molybdopterin-dependent catalytic subunit [Klenkia soli]
MNPPALDHEAANHEAAQREPRVVGTGRATAALTGVLSAAVALGVGELAAGVVGSSSSPVVAVSDAAVRATPEGLKEFAIATFGAADKAVLVGGVLVVVLLWAVGTGLAARRRPAAGVVAVGLFGLLGAVAAVTGPTGSPLDAVPSVLAGIAGVGVLLALLPRLQALAAGPDPGRRGVLLAGGAALGAAVVAGGGGLVLQRRFAVADAREDLVLPDPTDPAPALPDGADLAGAVDGLTPLLTSADDFYRVDTAISVPQLDPSTWALSVTGMVDRPGSITLAQLFARPDVVERDITLTCVSNEVGGTLAGSARWLGVPLGPLLREFGVQSGADQLLCRSSDGMTIGTPTRAALEVPDAMLAFGMNGAPLPVEHGFPVRMVVPGLYGYVSACKWLTGIEATTFDAQDAYWVQRGWAAEGPIRIASRIDTPVSDAAAGTVVVAGVAWAQGTGIDLVEVRVDDGEWRRAELAPEATVDLWRQWYLPVQLRSGEHQVSVRATDADGRRQPEEQAPPFPSGATGWHTITVDVA